MPWGSVEGQVLHLWKSYLTAATHIKNQERSHFSIAYTNLQRSSTPVNMRIASLSQGTIQIPKMFFIARCYDPPIGHGRSRKDMNRWYTLDYDDYVFLSSWRFLVIAGPGADGSQCCGQFCNVLVGWQVETCAGEMWSGDVARGWRTHLVVHPVCKWIITPVKSYRWA